jgi:hypothetical protein
LSLARFHHHQTFKKLKQRTSQRQGHARQPTINIHNQPSWFTHLLGTAFCVTFLAIDTTNKTPFFIFLAALSSRAVLCVVLYGAESRIVKNPLFPGPGFDDDNDVSQIDDDHAHAGFGNDHGPPVGGAGSGRRTAFVATFCSGGGAQDEYPPRRTRSRLGYGVHLGRYSHSKINHHQEVYHQDRNGWKGELPCFDFCIVVC